MIRRPHTPAAIARGFSLAPLVALLAAVSGFSLTACQATVSSDPAAIQVTPSGDVSLKQASYDVSDGADAVANNAVGVGERAPGFALPDATGQTVRLASLLREGPVVVTWYRGGWCPYCNRSLAQFQDHLDDIRASGANLVAISPETPDNSLSTVEKSKLDFHVLSDTTGQTARDYRVAYTLPQELQPRLSGLLSKHNADATPVLPITATYVIDTDSRVVWAFVTDDYSKRPNPEDIVAVLRSL